MGKMKETLMYDAIMSGDLPLINSLIHTPTYREGAKKSSELEETRSEVDRLTKLVEIAKWREKYNLTGSPELYDRKGDSLADTLALWIPGKVGADDTATCNWWEGDDGGPWATQCNELFNIESEGPEANGMKFCCFCGKKLNEVRAESEDEDE